MARALDGNLRNAIAHVPTNQVNYLRNSVKVVVDAYNGTMKYYVFDEQDPLLKTYRAAYPSLFAAKSEMPQALIEHLRYPEDLFNVQAELYSTYHVEDADVLYNKGDQWAIPENVYSLTDAGCAGLVCSGQELARVREAAPGLAYIVPGIRPAGANLADQKRVMTPREAFALGATIQCRKPFFVHSEQLQSDTSSSVPVTRKRTRPQWQPPLASSWPSAAANRLPKSPPRMP
jgi:hypothetical protein